MKTIFILIFLSFGASYAEQTDNERYNQILCELIEQFPEMRQLEDEINELVRDNQDIDFAGGAYKFRYEYDKAKDEFLDEMKELPEVKSLQDKMNEARVVYDQTRNHFFDEIQKQSPEFQKFRGEGQWFGTSEDEIIRLREYQQMIVESVAQDPALQLIATDLSRAESRLTNRRREYFQAIEKLEEQFFKLQLAACS